MVERHAHHADDAFDNLLPRRDDGVRTARRLVKALRSVGADFDLRDDAGKTALDDARSLYWTVTSGRPAEIYEKKQRRFSTAIPPLPPNPLFPLFSIHLSQPFHPFHQN